MKVYVCKVYGITNVSYHFTKKEEGFEVSTKDIKKYKTKASSKGELARLIYMEKEYQRGLKELFAMIEEEG